MNEKNQKARANLIPSENGANCSSVAVPVMDRRSIDAPMHDWSGGIQVCEYHLVSDPLQGRLNKAQCLLFAFWATTLRSVRNAIQYTFLASLCVKHYVNKSPTPGMPRLKKLDGALEDVNLLLPMLAGVCREDPLLNATS